MKLDRKGLLIMLAVVTVIALAILGRSYIQHTSEQKKVAQQIASAEMKLAGLPVEQLKTQKSQLEATALQINRQMNDAEARLFVTNDSISSSGALINTAKSSNVQILEISSTASTKDTATGISLQAIPVKVKVEGTMQNLIGFVYALKDRLPTAVVKDVRISDQSLKESTGNEGEAQQGGTTVAPKPGLATAEVSLIVYVDSGETL